MARDGSSGWTRSRLLPMLTLAACLAAAATSTHAGEAPVTNVSITLDPPDAGKQVVTVRLTPTETRQYSQFVFDCRLRQEFDWPGNKGQTIRRTIEPVTFTYRRPDVKMVDGLDLHISFFVPVDIAELRTRYGRSTFVTNAPVTVSRVTVTAHSDEGPIWSFTRPPVLTTVTPLSGSRVPPQPSTAPARKTP